MYRFAVNSSSHSDERYPRSTDNGAVPEGTVEPTLVSIVFHSGSQTSENLRTRCQKRDYKGDDDNRAVGGDSFRGTQN